MSDHSFNLSINFNWLKALIRPYIHSKSLKSTLKLNNLDNVLIILFFAPSSTIHAHTKSQTLNSINLTRLDSFDNSSIVLFIFIFFYVFSLTSVSLLNNNGAICSSIELFIYFSSQHKNPCFFLFNFQLGDLKSSLTPYDR